MEPEYVHICFTLVAEFSHKAARRRPLFNTQLCTDTSSSLWLPCCQSRRLLILPSSAQAHSPSSQARSHPFSMKGASSLSDSHLDCSLHVAAWNPPAFPMQADRVRCGVGSEGLLYAILSKLWKSLLKPNAMGVLLLRAIDWSSTHKNAAVDLNNVTDVQNFDSNFSQQPSSRRSVVGAILSLPPKVPT